MRRGLEKRGWSEQRRDKKGAAVREMKVRELSKGGGVMN